jgi:protein-tyrosine-phosphatase
MAGGPLPRAVLYACTLNSVRSPMAEAMTRFLFGATIATFSAGLRAGAPDGFAIVVMDEIGMDLLRHEPRTFQDIEDFDFDLVVTLSPEAHHGALEYCRDRDVAVEYWPTHDATAIEGDREQRLEAYRAVRDALMARIKQRFGWRTLGDI